MRNYKILPYITHLPINTTRDVSARSAAQNTTDKVGSCHWSCQRTNQPSSPHYHKPDFERAGGKRSSIHRPQLSSSSIHFADISPPYLYMAT
ncbi:hypothetical protein LOAG_09480 [Loa loa]|uniref:Uncharacterized protein n=1 Tax=Loa loa TaxID=7209 RepID=A0A1S0TRN4_LOALO|nr:hypothetical protein LOAG_09480 [Loa loa]EFO19016.1 hypothetical protein LOAG_09480 [Loa loa]